MKKPPSLFEIIVLPWMGIWVAEMFQTKKNELWFVVAPFMIIMFRLFMNGIQIPPKDAGAPDEAFGRLAAKSKGCNDGSVFFLMLAEGTAVVAASVRTEIGLWVVALVFYFVYMWLRLMSRRYWIAAASLGQC